MKRFLGFLCAVLLMVSVIIPASAVVPPADQAPINKDYTKAEIQAIAAAAFPEYADRITAEAAPSVYQALNSNTPDRVLLSKSKDLSDEMSVTYAEYASGANLAIVAWKDSGYDVTESETNGYLIHNVITFWIESNVSDATITRTDFRCTYAIDDYDIITHTGHTVNANSASYSLDPTSNVQMTETSARDAYVLYHGIFQSWLPDLPGSFLFRVKAIVGNNRFRLTVIDGW